MGCVSIHLQPQVEAWLREGNEGGSFMVGILGPDRHVEVDTRKIAGHLHAALPTKKSVCCETHWSSSHPKVGTADLAADAHSIFGQCLNVAARMLCYAGLHEYLLQVLRTCEHAAYTVVGDGMGCSTPGRSDNDKVVGV